MWKNRNNYKKILGKWKVTCDKSGFVFYNDQMVTDYRNKVIYGPYCDPVSILDMKRDSIEDNMTVPFKRPQIDPFIEHICPTWSEDEEYWSRGGPETWSEC